MMFIHGEISNMMKNQRQINSREKIFKFSKHLNAWTKEQKKKNWTNLKILEARVR